MLQLGGILGPQQDSISGIFLILLGDQTPKSSLPGSSGVHQEQRPVYPSTSQPWVGLRAEDPGDRHLRGCLGCLASLEVTRGWDQCRAQLPSGAPLCARPGLALIDYTRASARAQVAGPGHLWLPQGTAWLGTGEWEKKEGKGQGHL